MSWIQDVYGQKFVVDIQSLKLDKEAEEIRYFDDRQIRYIWNDDKKSFEKVLGLDKGLDLTYFDACQPVTQEQLARKLLLYRPNVIVIAITPIGTLLWKEVELDAALFLFENEYTCVM